MVEDQVSEVFRGVLTTLAGRAAFAVRGGAVPLGAESVRACVTISGAWEGGVWVRCTQTAGIDLVGWLTQECEVSPEDVIDVVGELANVVAGNVKTLFPAPSLLSLPTVVVGEDDDDAASGRELTRVSVQLEPHVFELSIYEAA